VKLVAQLRKEDIVTNDMLARAVRDGIARTIAVVGLAGVGYTLTRTVGLPQAMGDIGNWTEPLGLASLFVEGSLVALACTMLAGLRGASPRRFALDEAVRA
jgi:hypothetical protein